MVTLSVGSNFMKTLLYILTFIIASCNHRTKLSEQTRSIDSLPVKTTEAKIDKTKYYAKSDSLIITTENSDTLKYSKQDFNEIVDNFPALYREFVQDPQTNYYSNDKVNGFNSEVGQDSYYILYAFFLKKRTGEKRYNTEREKLIKIYNDINSIFGLLNYGGTYFGHRYRRIIGYAEYAVYQYKENGDYYRKKYDIKKQKQLYLALLRQKIADEISVDNEVPRKDEKAKRQRELFNYVDHLDGLITDNFYLEKAQEFQFLHY